ncbi:periplasmic solute binding protein [Pseudarthrobacter chlorophenolicus A6]|uniref:Periplasmic solute binding protein n=1 Tax=Pseudarthrobacter chlorophenolicus (strain ATCC 700700 / DSM 12829 / CIP 107037 / JCM 12360 / KCTC 9906 / NCIMB 13794 / A6) TaxID=452863 RepID=B8HB27_PSECP|nr:zinc ABC transporter substrate-binding protein [Pseudarthrobacter chlorophenolicus]ACL40341.1 periplasmic solute binding protein [Pseudarthrobacter chlorophenolicus A6]SDQ83323.1 zinc/manganese transport system substrate-binding protein [Pseudarthrobacter chlorophenolicus]
MRRSAVRPSLAALAGLGLLLSGCSAQPDSASPGTQSNEAGINVVASTNVYGDIASSVGGDKVSVTSIVTKTSQDPHSYEATAQDRLAVSKADLVITNGGGYDDFMNTLVDGSKLDAGNVLDAVELSGLEHAGEEAEPSASADAAAGDHGHDHGEFNEHVWYSLHAMEHLADELEAKLSAREPESAQEFKANAASFKSSLEELHGKLDTLKASGGGAQVAVTEPVPLYLLEDAGLVNATPADYTAAIEEGTDVPPAVLRAATDLVSGKSVRMLAYNEQTEGPQTEALKKAAEAAGVPVVDFNETLPEGKTYLQWMTDNVDNISTILESK